MQKEVQSKVYWTAGDKELKDYFEKNKARFTKPETVTLSEIFLSFAGRDENTVREKAKKLVVQLRAGGDFAKIAAENSYPGVVTQAEGKPTKLKVAELSDKITAPIKNVKVGGIADPIEADQVGIVILKVDAREQASSESISTKMPFAWRSCRKRCPRKRRNISLPSVPIRTSRSTTLIVRWSPQSFPGREKG